MSIHENNKVSLKEIELALEKHVNNVNQREEVLELCKQGNPLDILYARGYREVAADAISLANGTINKNTIISRIKENHSLISINFLSITQAKYQLEKIVEAIDIEIKRFIGKECIIHGSCYEDGDLPHELNMDNEPIPDSIEAYQSDEESIPEHNDEHQDEKHQVADVYIEFINTRRGRVQLERLRKAIDAELNKFEAKGLIASYNNNDKGTENYGPNYTKESIKDIEKEHKVRIAIY